MTRRICIAESMSALRYRLNGWRVAFVIEIPGQDDRVDITMRCELIDSIEDLSRLNLPFTGEGRWVGEVGRYDGDPALLDCKLSQKGLSREIARKIGQCDG